MVAPPESSQFHGMIHPFYINGGSGGKPHQSKPTAASHGYRSQSGHRASSKLPSSPNRRKFRPETVGPVSFARAERPGIADEPTRREESYGKHVARLLTDTGDVVVTLNRRRNSDWGRAQDHGGATASIIRRRRTNEIDQGKQIGQHDGTPDGQQCMSKHTRHRAEWFMKTKTISEKMKHGTRSATPQAEAFKLLSEVSSPALPYREPGRAELPVIFCAASAPISQPRNDQLRCNQDKRRVTPQRLVAVPKQGGNDRTIDRRSSEEKNDEVARIVHGAEAVLTSIPSPLSRQSWEGSSAAVKQKGRKGESLTAGETHDTTSSTLWSDAETTRLPRGAE